MRLVARALSRLSLSLSLLVLLAFALAGCSPRPTVHPPAPVAFRCPTGVRAVLPAYATAWLFARPHAIYEHPQLGPILTRTVDAAGERALLERTLRSGFDLRALDRAAVAWTPRGTLYVAAGSLDTARVTTLLWDRLLNPRRRTRDERSNERVEGMLGRDRVALLVSPECGLAAYAEGGITRAVDRVLAPPSPAAAPSAPSPAPAPAPTPSAPLAQPDPDDLLVWHTSQLPSQLDRTETSALVYFVREIEVRARAQADGLRIALRLSGPLPADAPERLRRTLTALAESPLGELAGAPQWLTPERVRLEPSPGALTATILLPWRALAAIAEAMRGEVGGEAVH